MAIAWFLCPYKRLPHATKVMRYCAMDDFTALILADGGTWAETEVLGNSAVVKVRASSTTLATISGQPDFLYLLGDTPLDTLMAALTTQQRNVTNTKLRTQGYPQAEIDAALGNTLTKWRAHTYRQLLDFVATRRRKPRYDRDTDTVICDGPEQPVRPVESVNSEVT